MNQITLLGRLTKDIEKKETYCNFLEEKETYCKFTLAVNGTKKGEADFFQCVAFGKTSEILSKHCEKGSQIAVEGRVKLGNYEKDGIKHYTTEVVINKFHFCGKSIKNVDNDELLF